MADELYNCAVAVKALVDDIRVDGKRFVERTHLGPPSAVLTKLEVAVIMDDLRQHQLGTYTSNRRNYLTLRGYAPMALEPEIAEAKLMKLWDLMIDKMDVNKSLGGTATRSNLERGRPGIKMVAGTKCRTLDARLEVQLAQAVAYQATED
jgi:hypothetical protein